MPPPLPRVTDRAHRTASAEQHGAGVPGVVGDPRAAAGGRSDVRAGSTRSVPSGPTFLGGAHYARPTRRLSPIPRHPVPATMTRKRGHQRPALNKDCTGQRWVCEPAEGRDPRRSHVSRGPPRASSPYRSDEERGAIMDEFDPPRVIIRFHSHVEVPERAADVLRSRIRRAGGSWWRSTARWAPPARLHRARPATAARAPGACRASGSHLSRGAARSVLRRACAGSEGSGVGGEAPSGNGPRCAPSRSRWWVRTRSSTSPIDPRNTNQDYLDAAPTGIDARYAWAFPGGDGAGQRIVDLERGGPSTTKTSPHTV